MENQGLPRALVTGIAGLIFIVLFGSSMFVTIEPGEKVYYSKNLLEV